jgi:hypothetical protein
MGVLAVGSTAAFALLVSATATGHRAERLVGSSLLADSVFTEVEAELNGGFTLKKLEALEVANNGARSVAVGEGPLRATPPMDPNWTDSGPAPGAPTPAATPPGNKAPAAYNGPPRAWSEDPFAAAKTRWWKKNATSTVFPDYTYDVAITPVGGPPDDPWEFLVEVVIRWTVRGQKRDGVYQTILLKKLGHLDNR